MEVSAPKWVMTVRSFSTCSAKGRVSESARREERERSHMLVKCILLPLNQACSSVLG